MTPQEFETYREENHLTHKTIASMIGIPYITYYGFVRKNKKPQLSTWKKLEKFYNENIERKEVSVEEFFESLSVKTERKPKTQTVYLESVEELLGELLDGNEVHVESSTGHTLKIVNGFIVRYSNDNPISINAPILCSERYYAIKPIPLNLEVGKRYISRDGRVATVFNQFDHVFHGVFDGEPDIRSYTSNGGCVNFNTDNDLIEEI